MKFTVSTKPLKNVTDLGIIKANISKYYYRSSIVQITASRDTLKLNIEASGIKTRMTLKGSGDSDKPVTIMVECAKFKTLLNSIETDVVTLEFIEGGMYVHAGSSKFAISQMVDSADVQLSEPIDQYQAASTMTIKPEDWQFIKDHQMYAISGSENHPVYKHVWISENKDVIVGDYDLGIFTYSKRGDFGSTCLLSSSLINLLTSIPEGSTISKVDRNYVLTISTDSYSMITEFTPKYEDDEAVGSYNSEIILGMLNHPEKYIKLEVSPIIKFINQSAILSQTDADKILDFTIKDETLTLTNRTSSYSMPVSATDPYTVKFATEFIKSVLSNFDSDEICIAPMTRDTTDEDGKPTKMVIGCIFWTDTLTTVLAGQG